MATKEGRGEVVGIRPRATGLRKRPWLQAEQCSHASVPALTKSLSYPTGTIQTQCVLPLASPPLQTQMHLALNVDAFASLRDPVRDHLHTGLLLQIRMSLPQNCPASAFPLSQRRTSLQSQSATHSKSPQTVSQNGHRSNPTQSPKEHSTCCSMSSPKHHFQSRGVDHLTVDNRRPLQPLQCGGAVSVRMTRRTRRSGRRADKA